MAAWESAGDIAPFIAIGAKLRQRGHDVTVVSMPVFEAAVAEAGLSFVGVG